MIKNIAGQTVGAQMITTADGTDFTGSVSVLVVVDNGSQGAGAGTAPAHKGSGYHSYTPTQSETNGEHVEFTFTGTGAITAGVQVYTNTPQSADNTALINALNDFDPTSDTVANVTLVATTTTNDDMRGTDSANTTTPPTAAAITDAVWDEVQSGHTTAGTFGKFVDVEVSSVSGGGGLTQQNVRDAMKLTPTGGAPSSDSVDEHLDDILADTTQIDADTDDIQSRIPAALVSGRMDSNVSAIDDFAEAATDLAASARTIVVGVAETGTLSTTQMTTDLVEATDDHYNGRIIIWTSGALKDQATNITDYAGSNGLLTFTAVTEAASNTDAFVIV